MRKGKDRSGGPESKKRGEHLLSVPGDIAREFSYIQSSLVRQSSSSWRPRRTQLSGMKVFVMEACANIFHRANLIINIGVEGQPALEPFAIAQEHESDRSPIEHVGIGRFVRSSQYNVPECARVEPLASRFRAFCSGDYHVDTSTERKPRPSSRGIFGCSVFPSPHFPRLGDSCNFHELLIELASFLIPGGFLGYAV